MPNTSSIPSVVQNTIPDSDGQTDGQIDAHTMTAILRWHSVARKKMIVQKEREHSFRTLFTTLVQIISADYYGPFTRCALLRDMRLRAGKNAFVFYYGCSNASGVAR